MPAAPLLVFEAYEAKGDLLHLWKSAVNGGGGESSASPTFKISSYFFVKIYHYFL